MSWKKPQPNPTANIGICGDIHVRAEMFLYFIRKFKIIITTSFLLLLTIICAIFAADSCAPAIWSKLHRRSVCTVFASNNAVKKLHKHQNRSAELTTMEM